LNSPEQIYFNVNKEAKSHDVFFLRKHETSDTEKHLAYMLNTTGSMECTLKIRDLETGVDLELERKGLNGSFEWISGTQLVYIKRDQTGRGQKIYLLDLNAPDGDKFTNQVIKNNSS
jgi:oligopeptidase B